MVEQERINVLAAGAVVKRRAGRRNGPETTASGLCSNEGHRLVRPGDVAAFGDVEVMVPGGPIEKEGPRDHRVLTDWEEGRSTDLIVTSPESGRFAALIQRLLQVLIATGGSDGAHRLARSEETLMGIGSR